MAKDITGKHGPRKIVVPNLLNLTISEARNTLTQLGLNYSETSEETTVSNDNEKVFQQLPGSGSLVLVGSEVSLHYYIFTAPPPFFPYFPPFFPFFPFFPPYFPPWFPFFPYFPPFFPFFPPDFGPYFKNGKTGCIGENTLILKNTKEYMPAKEIKPGDILLTIDPKDFSNTKEHSYFLSSQVNLIEINVVSVESSVKDAYSINSEDAYFSGSQPIFVKSDDIVKYINVSDLKIGDTIISIDEQCFITETIVESINKIENHKVYDIRTEPYQWFIAGGHIVIS